MIEVSVHLSAMPIDCPAYESGDRYSLSVSGKSFGCGCPCKDREEIIARAKEYIKNEEDWHKDKIKIKFFENFTDLDISVEELKANGVKKLNEWIEV